MKIVYKQGDLLECSENIILHGCNAQSTMGSGVAKAIRAKYPEAFRAYLAGIMELGIVTYAAMDDNKIIMNAITQEFYGRQVGKQYVSYEAVRECFQRINWWAGNTYKEGDASIAMPKIGAGLGGGEWDVIAQIIEEESVNFQPVVYELEQQ